MPTVFRVGSRRYFFRAGDCTKNLANIHCTEGNNEAVFGFRAVKMLRAGGFKKHELLEIEREIEAHLEVIEAVWQQLCE